MRELKYTDKQMDDLEISGRIHYARELMEIGKPEEAYEFLCPIPRHALRREDFNLLLFEICSAGRDWKKALRHIHLLQKINPNEVDYRLMAAQCYMEMGYPDTARQILNKIPA